jgi:uncharacterized membrane protein
VTSVPDLRPSPGPYKDISPAGWPGFLAVLAVMFGVLPLFVSDEVEKILAWILVAAVVVSILWKLLSYARSRKEPFDDFRLSLSSLKDFGATEWFGLLGILGVFFIWVLLLTLNFSAIEEVTSWVFVAVAVVALAFYVLARLRQK